MLKKLLSISISLLITWFAVANPALAEDASNGAKIFNANCAACHSGGNNLVNATKTLKKDALEKYEAGMIAERQYRLIAEQAEREAGE